MKTVKLCDYFLEITPNKVFTFRDLITEDCILDFENITYISSAGIGIMFSKCSELNAKNEKLKVMNVSERIYKLLKVCGLDNYIEEVKNN